MVCTEFERNKFQSEGWLQKLEEAFEKISNCADEEAIADLISFISLFKVWTYGSMELLLELLRALLLVLLSAHAASVCILSYTGA